MTDSIKKQDRSTAKKKKNEQNGQVFRRLVTQSVDFPNANFETHEMTARDEMMIFRRK